MKNAIFINNYNFYKEQIEQAISPYKKIIEIEKRNVIVIFDKKSDINELLNKIKENLPDYIVKNIHQIIGIRDTKDRIIITLPYIKRYIKKSQKDYLSLMSNI